jgi:TPR repeat protein
LAAQAVLGLCYLDGIGVGRDYDEAFRFLSAAAQRGAPRAHIGLARMYADGMGVPRKAIELCQRGSTDLAKAQPDRFCPILAIRAAGDVLPVRARSPIARACADFDRLSETSESRGTGWWEQNGFELSVPFLVYQTTANCSV